MAAAKARRLAPLRFPPRPPTTRPSLQSVCKAGERRGRKETFNNDLAAKGERKEVGARRRRRDVGRGREGNERMGEETWEDFSSPLFFSPPPLSFPHPSPPFSPSPLKPPPSPPSLPPTPLSSYSQLIRKRRRKRGGACAIPLCCLGRLSFFFPPLILLLLFCPPPSTPTSSSRSPFSFFLPPLLPSSDAFQSR